MFSLVYGRLRLEFGTVRAYFGVDSDAFVRYPIV